MVTKPKAYLLSKSSVWARGLEKFVPSLTASSFQLITVTALRLNMYLFHVRTSEHSFNRISTLIHRYVSPSGVVLCPIRLHG